VDPGDEAAKIIESLAKVSLKNGKKIEIKTLLHTHGHLDHVGATRDVSRALELQGMKPQIALHREDEPLYQNLKVQGQMFGFNYEDPLPISHFLEHEEKFKVGDLQFSVVHTPGHSPGSVCLRLHEDSGAGARETLFTGDTLFKDSVGRSDLWGGDQSLMFKSIRERIFTLDGDTQVCPGHGQDSLIGREKISNPFFR
jgi:glyoxylase-like metal-dependent hydrolase (beta-lactamase superfamily II)